MENATISETAIDLFQEMNRLAALRRLIYLNLHDMLVNRISIKMRLIYVYNERCGPGGRGFAGNSF